MNEALDSIDASKVANLFHDLSKLTDDDDMMSTVPDCIHEIVHDFKNAQEEFILSIDKYMHRYSWDRFETEIKIDETIVKACPEFLASRNEDHELPIHCASGDIDSELEFVPMLAKYGVKNNDIGNRISRGGLLETFNESEKNVLQVIKNVKTFQSLANMDPPPFLPEDVLGQDLLHYCSDNADIIKFLVGKAIKFDPSHSSIGGLFSRNNGGIFSNGDMFAIERFQNIDVIFKAVAQVMSHHEHIPILHKVIEHTPQFVDRIITFCPHATTTRDENGRLPIHISFESGMKTSLGLAAIMSASAEHLGALDPVTKFCPSALAALNPSCDLDTIYRLLRTHPSHVDQGRKCRLFTNPNVHSSKLQKTRR